VSTGDALQYPPEDSTMIERNIDGGILTLRLAHKRASALDTELLLGLLDELETADDDVRAVVLTGTGSIFSAGVDLFRLTEGGAAYVQRFLPLLSRFLRALFAFPKPVVAAAGRTLEPDAARAAGFIDEVVAPGDLLARAQTIARQLACVPSESYRLTKQYLRAAALARMDASTDNDAAALAIWSAAQTHANIREYLGRTVKR
jgi:enoyl-CoA hydratase/carnithine racemase